jgi:hypothetical protein
MSVVSGLSGVELSFEVVISEEGGSGCGLIWSVGGWDGCDQC